MMTAHNYLIFRNRIDPIIRACSVSPETRYRVPRDDLAHYKGETTFTAGKIYYFSVSRAKAHQRQMLEICRDLPKMDAVLPGTACTITSLELIRRTPNPALLGPQFEAAEQFFALLTLADIATFRCFKSKRGISYLNANIMYDFKDFVVP